MSDAANCQPVPRVHVGDALRWSKTTPALDSEYELRNGEAVIGSFRSIARLGPVVAEGEFGGRRWRLEQRGLTKLRYVVAWLDVDGAVTSETSFLVGNNTLAGSEGRTFAFSSASADASGGWRSDLGELAVEESARDAATGYFHLTSAAQDDPLVPALLIAARQYRGVQAGRGYLEYEGASSAIRLALDAVLRLFGR